MSTTVANNWKGPAGSRCWCGTQLAHSSLSSSQIPFFCFPGSWDQLPPGSSLEGERCQLFCPSVWMSRAWRQWDTHVGTSSSFGLQLATALPHFLYSFPSHVLARLAWGLAPDASMTPLQGQLNPPPNHIRSNPYKKSSLSVMGLLLWLNPCWCKDRNPLWPWRVQDKGWWRTGDSNSFPYGHETVLTETGECRQSLSEQFL